MQIVVKAKVAEETLTQRQRVKDALVTTIEKMAENARAAAEVEALAAAALAFDQVDKF